MKSFIKNVWGVILWVIMAVLEAVVGIMSVIAYILNNFIKLLENGACKINESEACRDGQNIIREIVDMEA